MWNTCRLTHPCIFSTCKGVAGDNHPEFSSNCLWVTTAKGRWDSSWDGPAFQMTQVKPMVSSWAKGRVMVNRREDKTGKWGGRRPSPLKHSHKQREAQTCLWVTVGCSAIDYLLPRISKRHPQLYPITGGSPGLCRTCLKSILYL